jgi:hypothetical protein
MITLHASDSTDARVSETVGPSGTPPSRHPLHLNQARAGEGQAHPHLSKGANSASRGHLAEGAQLAAIGAPRRIPDCWPPVATRIRCGSARQVGMAC